LPNRPGPPAADLPNGPDPLAADLSGDPPLEALGQPDTQPGFNLQTSYPTLQWGSLLSQNNFAGRGWLMNQISVATPSLTQGQIDQITAALKRPTFPVDLANLVASKAAQVSQSSFGASIGDLVSNQTAADVCTNGGWSNCAIAVKQALDKHPGTPSNIAALAELWGTTYDAQYDSLRKQGHLERSTPDSQKFYEAVKSKLDPTEIAKDHAEDAVLRWAFSLARLDFVLKWVDLPPVQALKQFFDGSETASDFDELQLSDDILQQQLAMQLAPFLKPDWKPRLSTAVDQSKAQWLIP
jgi:hypothetical protein